MDLRYVLSPPDSLRVCFICCRSPNDGVKLMKCNGCLDPPTYCSKECQKAHWPVHKQYCKSTSKEIASGPSSQSEGLCGFASPKELVQTFSEFLLAHQWALESATKINAFLKYGYALQEPDRAVTRFVFARTSPAQNPSGNPARNFMFRHAELLNEDEARRISKDSATAKNAIEQFKFNCPKDTRLPDGAMFAQSVLDGTMHQKIHSFPWYRLNPHLIPDLDPSPHLSPDLNFAKARLSMNVYLQDLRDICLRSLNTDLPFRPLVGDKNDLQMPVPGRYKRVRKEWVWEPLFTSWDDYLEGRTQCEPLYALAGRKTTKSPEHMMYLLYDL